VRKALVSFIAVSIVMLIGVPANATLPQSVAVNRCTSQVVDEAYGRIRDLDRHASGPSTGELLKRYGAIADVLTTLHEEREIVDSVCSSDAARAPLFTEIAATTAWALTLEADVAGALSASCPAAQKALPMMMLADAWLAMAKVINDANGAVPSLFADPIAKVRTRATTVGLALPAWSETSRYWRDNVAVEAKEAAATCPSPSPSSG
jgi:hypothetical protein